MPLEIRQIGGARTIAGHFPYNATATMADRGTIRKESFASGAFKYALENHERKIDFLVGHDWGRPIANRQTGSLTLTESAAGVDLEARLPDEALTPSWVVDVEKAIANGTMVGLSPGFRIPPPGVVPRAEQLVPEPGNPSVQIRLINSAVWREFSIVTAGVYETAGVELRAEDWDDDWEETESGITVPGALTLWL